MSKARSRTGWRHDHAVSMEERNASSDDGVVSAGGRGFASRENDARALSRRCRMKWAQGWLGRIGLYVVHSTVRKRRVASVGTTRRMPAIEVDTGD